MRLNIPRLSVMASHVMVNWHMLRRPPRAYRCSDARRGVRVHMGSHIACPIGTGIEVMIPSSRSSLNIRTVIGSLRDRPRPTVAPDSSPSGKSREGSSKGHVPVVVSAPLAAATMSYAMNRSSAQVAMLRSVGSLKTPCPERFHLQ